MNSQINLGKSVKNEIKLSSSVCKILDDALDTQTNTYLCNLLVDQIYMLLHVQTQTHLIRPVAIPIFDKRIR